MRNNIFYLAAAALVFVGCTSDELRSNIQDEQTEIGFSAITNKQTRAENSSAGINGNLEAYNTTFKVWAYKVVNTTETPVLGAVEGTNNTYTYPGQLVEHKDADNNVNPAVTEGWYYTPVRFWDKSATTPATAIVPNKVLTEALTTEDLMISTDIEDYKNYSNTPVNLSFNHILSRLNIGVRKATILDDYTVYLKSVKVFNMKKNGSFDESLATGTTLSSGTVARWTAATTPATFTSGVGYENASGLEITSTATTENTYYQYVYEGLAIPQSVAYSKTVLVNEDVTGLDSYLYLNGSNATTTSAPYIVIEYEIGKTENNVYTKHDSYKYYYNLADVFNADAPKAVDFCEGWQNTLKITLAPAAINFDADVYEWATKNDVPVDIQ